MNASSLPMATLAVLIAISAAPSAIAQTPPSSAKVAAGLDAEARLREAILAQRVDGKPLADDPLMQAMEADFRLALAEAVASQATMKTIVYSDGTVDQPTQLPGLRAARVLTALASAEHRQRSVDAPQWARFRARIDAHAWPPVLAVVGVGEADMMTPTPLVDAFGNQQPDLPPGWSGITHRQRTSGDRAAREDLLARVLADVLYRPLDDGQTLGETLDEAGTEALENALASWALSRPLDYSPRGVIVARASLTAANLPAMTTTAGVPIDAAAVLPKPLEAVGTSFPLEDDGAALRSIGVRFAGTAPDAFAGRETVVATSNLTPVESADASDELQRATAIANARLALWKRAAAIRIDVDFTVADVLIAHPEAKADLALWLDTARARSIRREDDGRYRVELSAELPRVWRIVQAHGVPEVIGERR